MNIGYMEAKRAKVNETLIHMHANDSSSSSAFLLLLSFSPNPLVHYSFHFNARPQHTSVNDADYWDPIKMSTLPIVQRLNNRRAFRIGETDDERERKRPSEWQTADDG